MHLQEKKLDIAFIQNPEEALFLLPTEQDIQKSDLSVQFLPSKLKLKVKGETLLSGDLPEDIDTDGAPVTIFEFPCIYPISTILPLTITKVECHSSS